MIRKEVADIDVKIVAQKDKRIENEGDKQDKITSVEEDVEIKLMQDVYCFFGNCSDHIKIKSKNEE